MQLTLPLDDPAKTVTSSQSRQRSMSAKRDSHKSADRSMQAQMVLKAIDAAGTVGLTRNEIADRIGVALSSVCGRVNELLNSPVPKIYVAELRRDGRSVLVSRM